MVTLIREQLRHGYAMVQVYSMPEALVFSAVGPRLAGVPLIYDADDLTADLFATKFAGRAVWPLVILLRAQERVCLRFVDLIITVHDDYRRRLRARGVSPHRMRVVMNLPDQRILERGRARPRPSKGNGFVIVHHGTLAQRYGVDLAIRAVDQLRERVPGLRLHIYGEGDHSSTLSNMIEDLSLTDQVTLRIGYVPLEELVPELLAADIAVVPNRADLFTHTILPTKLLEYLALGLPTIVTRTRTVESHVPPDVVEYCEPDRADALASAIERLWADPDRRRELATRAQAFSQEHSWDHEARAYCATVDELVNARRP
jgi:glycosyltransferase involved in cell wall biosynthesis